MAQEALYEVVERLGQDVEVRRYNKQTWALYHHPDNDKSFTHLLAYIEGRNSESRQIPMTVPVASGIDEEGFYMAFIMPDDIEKAPEPSDRNIVLKEVPERRLAVLPLIGYVSPESFDRDRKLIAKILEGKNMKLRGEPILLQYSNPWTPPMQQRKELAYEV